MSSISSGDVKRLRDATGAGFMDCKRALQDAGGDFEEAVKLLRQRGLADAAKRKGREAKEGIIHAYLHAPSPGLPPRVGVLLELNCETDFVAKTPEFRELANELALHIAAMRPLYVSEEEIPPSVLETERELARKKVEGKPPNVQEKAMEGAVRKYVSQFCLLAQPFVRDDKQTVGELIDSYAGRIGENIAIRRFVRYEVAEALD